MTGRFPLRSASAQGDEPCPDDAVGPPVEGGSDPAGSSRTATTRDLPDGDDEGLPTALAAAVTDFVRHLRYERGLSEHTVRAYTSDVTAALRHLVGRAATRRPTTGGPRTTGGRGTTLDDLDLAALRSWLASGGVEEPGRAGRTGEAGRRPARRTTVARRAA
ncbi:site-specific integrase, partial [Actinomycetospora atypica]